MLGDGVGAVAYGAEAVQRGDAPGGGEVAVAAATHPDAFQLPAKLCGSGFGGFKKSLIGGREFKGRAGESAGNFQLHPVQVGLQSVDRLCDPLASL